jgi:hypothetical protein
MTTYTWPSNLVPAEQRLQILNNQGVSVSPLSGYVQTNTHPGSRWGWALDMPPALNDSRAAFEAFIVKLSGREHRVSLYDFKRPRPRGTINLTGVTVNTTASQFANSISLIGCGAGTTLLAGDWVKFTGGQLVMVTDDATADGGGLMSITFRHMLRASVAAASAVTLSAPTALYILSDSRQEFARMPSRMAPGVSFDFEEVFA